MGKIYKINGFNASSDTTADITKFSDILKRASHELYDNGKLNRELFSDTLDAFGVICKLDTPILVDEIYALLDSKNDTIRAEAVATLGYSTRFHLLEFRDKAYEILTTDKSDYVRAKAILAWSGYYFDTFNPSSLWRLYVILKNEFNDIDVRIEAFCGICNIATNEYPAYSPYTTLSMLIECRTTEEFNSKIDWNEVERIINKYVPPEMRTEK